MQKNKAVSYINLELIDYKVCWDFQEKLFNSIIEQKIANRNSDHPQATHNFLIFCEHPHVYTLGKSGSMDNLLLSESALEQKGASFYKINRGGDITYHGPGQLVMYPIFDLENFFTDIHRYLRYLEQAVINVCERFGVAAGRYDGYTGVWIDTHDASAARKICAMGVKCSRWVSMHGIAFNIHTDLSYFNHIIPCGIKDKDVSSLSRELQNACPGISAVRHALMEEMKNVFQIESLSAYQGEVPSTKLPYHAE
jgi:lipoyl(octanoyl) transferase